jgi:hypothetical protein
MTREEMVREGVRRLKELDIYPPYVRKFNSKANVPTFFERFGGFYADQEPKLMAKIREVEAEHNCVVYAVTHEIVEGMNMWSMLIVSNDKDEWPWEFMNDDRSTTAWAWVWNTDMPDFSEFGSVTIRSFGGGICRM